MRIRFTIPYHTDWGQRLFVAGSIPELGEWNADRAAEMTFTPGGMWALEIDLPRDCAPDFCYKYFVCHEAVGAREWEWGANRRFACEPGRFTRADVQDFWRPARRPENALYTSAFGRAVLRFDPGQGPEGGASTARKRVHRFRVAAPMVGPGRVLCLLGNAPSIGRWDPAEAVTMHRADYPFWEADVAFRGGPFPVVYKYLSRNTDGRGAVTWEDGPNRSFLVEPDGRLRKLALRNDYPFRRPGPPWRGAGVNVPVFSLRSESSLGVGEFPDIRLLVDWARKAGLSMIQLLPVNDTIATHTWRDSYPYAAVSVFALHPIYMNLEAMGIPEHEAPLDNARRERAALNAKDAVDYEEVMAVKSRYFKQAYDAVRDELPADPGFRAFFEDNREWLVPYAVFSCLRDRYKTSDHTQWPEYGRPDRARIEAFANPAEPHYDDVAVHYFIQYHLHRQLLDAARYARQYRVVLKGDIPIGVYRHSADTWVAPELYNMAAQAGAPPDGFSADGQNWKFPTYNWEAMAADGYAWWQARLRKMSAYFDAFRIDHILGFFRIWEIPREQVQGIMGRFNPSLPFDKAELEAWGVWFDRDRLCEPYIRRHILDGRFGEDADRVIDEYLVETQPGCFRFKPELASQRAIREHLSAGSEVQPGLREDRQQLMWALFDMVADVLFLEDPDRPGRYHPRNAFHRTNSYAEADPWTRIRLNGLYTEYYYRRHEQFWREQALVRLPAIRNATDMLICGEDLGMVPDCVAGVMDELELLSLFVERMPKEPQREFHHPADCPYLSVCTPSTHDMSPVRLWWEEDRGRTQRFYNHMLRRDGPAPFYCEDWVSREIVAGHLDGPSMWAVFLLQDLLAMSEGLRRKDPREERINVPSNPEHYWQYRMHVGLEELLQAEDFNSMLRGMLRDSGRWQGSSGTTPASLSCGGLSACRTTPTSLSRG